MSGTQDEVVHVQRLTSNIGAAISGVDLTQPLASIVVEALDRALEQNGVIFFKGQDLSADQMRAFVANFGTPAPEPLGLAGTPNAPDVSQGNQQVVKRSTAVWHSDSTFVPEPQALTALRAVKLPSVGGDTCWASMYAAYDALSEPMRAMLDGLSGVHSLDPVLGRLEGEARRRIAANEDYYGTRETTHPLIRVHPVTGRKALFFNEAWTVRIPELMKAESDHLIALLREHVKSPDFAVRWRWEPNDVALWDNRSVQHYAVPDYTEERIMQRLVTLGDRPAGPRRAAA